MRNRVQIALAVSLVATGVIAWQVLRSKEPEPSYRGKPLSVWLAQYYDAIEDPESPMTGGPTVTGVTADGLGGEESAKQAEAALRAIGTNALPVLLTMANAHNSALEREWIHLSYRQSLIPFHPRSDFVYRGMAALGFFTLGSDARPAVPALTRLLSEQCADVRASTARTLGFMGDTAQAACPALVKSLRDKDAETRLAAAEALKKIDPERARR